VERKRRRVRFRENRIVMGASLRSQRQCDAGEQRGRKIP
jgi:hypothetical protein